MTPSPAPLLDAVARETFIHTLDENFCVSAGAGVGKTTAITRRIANLATQRHGERNILSRLVVVTYGKLAAEELRIRTRDLVLQQLDKSAQGRQTLLADLRGAFFGTIHSFCLKLIREQGRFLGLPETVDLLEDHDAGPMWERFCESDVVDNLGLPPDLLARVSRHLSFDQLLDLARNLGPEVTEASNVFRPEDEPPTLNFSVALDDDGGRSKDKTRDHQRNLRQWIAEYEGDAPFVELPSYTGGSKSFLAAVDAATEPYARWLNEAAGSLAVRIARAFRDFRLEKGLMTYRDQIFWCKRLVEDPVVLRRLRARQYRVILDEAQDTDAEMFAILTEIARPVDAQVGAWPVQPDAPGPEPGRFSFVGDDQQAIYGERADLAIYQRYIEAFKAGRGGKHLEFSVTMRCPRRVIDVVNGVFADGRLPQAVTFRSLDPRPGCPDGAAWRLDLDPIQGGDGKPSQGDQLLHECAQVADFVAARGLAGFGIARWSEMAVIAPRIGWLETCAREFAARGVPGNLLSQKSIAREQARHSWPAALLHVLVHPWDRFELIGVLREIFAVSDVDMARLHRRQGAEESPGLSFWPLAPSRTKGDVPSPRLRHALEMLHDLRAAFPIDTPKGGASTHGLSAVEGAGTLSRYVDLVLEKTALAARMEAIGEPSGTLEQLRAWALRAECEHVTLRAWVRSVVDALEQPAPAADDGQAAVQFLTCLKAKGLEWPVVIPLGMGHKIGERTPVYPRVVRSGGETEIHFSSATIDPAQKARATTSCAEEFQRMLYVTLTRAKRLLLVPDSSALYAGRAPNFLELARWDELALPHLFSVPPVQEKNGEPPPPAPPDEGPRVFHDDSRRLARAVKISQDIPKRLLPSSLSHHGPARSANVADTPADREDDRRLASEEANLLDSDGGEPLAGIGGIDYGNWWHATLQRYPWNAPGGEPERESYLHEQRARIAASVAWTSRALEELRRFTASEAHAEFVAQGEVFLAEMPFSHPRSEAEWIEGIMDLVIVTRGGAGLWIVDWKTDRRRPSDASDDALLQRLAEKYGAQLRAYAEVFARGLGRPVNRLLLYSTALGQTVAVKG